MPTKVHFLTMTWQWNDLPYQLDLAPSDITIHATVVFCRNGKVAFNSCTESTLQIFCF